MWRVDYCPSDRMLAIITRWFATEAAAQKFAKLWKIACTCDPNGNQLKIVK